MLNKLRTIFRHRWMDASDTRRALPREALQRLTERVRASEHRHDGEVRICVEAALPLSYVWRHVWHGQALPVVTRQRALMLFGKLRVWDTERNNGVLIYLLLAERSIELVADRGLNQRVPPARWQAIVQGLRAALQDGRMEEGLILALDEVSTLLEQHFPAVAGQEGRNELSNRPVLL